MPLDGLAHNEQLSLFLNLYHVMLLHSFFLLGPPGSPLRYVFLLRENLVLHFGNCAFLRCFSNQRTKINGNCPETSIFDVLRRRRF